MSGYIVTANIPYARIGDFEAKLDVYRPCDVATPRPALTFFHAGGWLHGSFKETWMLWFLPFLQLGWVVVNVEYRPAGVALAPAAMADCLYAWHWINCNAAEHGIDSAQHVLGGLSAGGHLALTTGMIPQSTRASSAPERAVLEYFDDALRTAAELPKPAAILNWSGVSDVAELADGQHRQDFAVTWVGERSNRLALARLASPVNYVRAGVPPVVTIHGDEDESVPYSQATRLHAMLCQAGVTNELITIRGAGHSLGLEANRTAYPRILKFLTRVGIKVRPR